MQMLWQHKALSTWLGRLGRVRYNAVLAAIELFTTKQQRHLQAQEMMEMQPIIVSNKFKLHHGIIFSVHSRAEQKRSCTGYPQCCETLHFSAFQWFYVVLVHVFRSTIESIELLAHESLVFSSVSRVFDLCYLWFEGGHVPSTQNSFARTGLSESLRKSRSKMNLDQFGPCNAPIPWICWDFFRRGTKLLRHLAHGLSCFLSSVADR